MCGAIRCCLICLAIAGMANFAFAQGMSSELGSRGPVVQNPDSSMSLPPLFPSGFQEMISLGGIRVRPTLRIGYQSLGLNFTIPAFAHEDNSPAPLDLSLRNANVWVGSVRLDIELSPGLFLFAAGDANAKRNITVITSDEPLNYQDVVTFKPIEWTGSQFQWWSVEGGLGYRLFPATGLIAGLRRDHLTLQPSDPRDAAGNPVNYDATFSNRAVSERAYSDILVTNWIPYFGVELMGQFFRASLLWSPFANADVRIPVRYVRNLALFVGQNFNTSLDYNFKLQKPGTFLEGNFEYLMPLGRTLSFGPWFKGTWLRMTGTGEMTAEFNLQRVGGGTRDVFAQGALDEQTATYTRYILAGGLWASAIF